MDAKSLVFLLLVASCVRAAPVRTVPPPKSGDMTRLASAPALTFVGPVPMKNAQGVAYADGNFCLGHPDGVVEYLESDGEMLILRYHAPVQRPINVRSGQSVTIERERMECPDKGLIRSSAEEWAAFVRADLTADPDDKARRARIREILKRYPP